MHNEDIKQLLDHSSKEIENIAAQAKDEQINKVTLKNTLENLRSILDYLAKDISSKLKQNPNNKKLPDKVYFPYGQKENHFKNSIKKNLLPLKQDEPEIYKLIEDAQPFKAKSNWLVDLCLLTNEAKHNNLTKTREQKTVAVTQKGLLHVEGRNISIRNNYVNGVRQDDVFVGDNGEVTVVEHAGGTKITVNNRIKFHGKELEVVPFLKGCHEKLDILSSKIGSILYENA